jgi:hypothetical protein
MIIGKGASSTDILGWDFSVMGAKSYVPKLSENVRRSLEYKRRNGEWGGNAPLGYLNQRDGNGPRGRPPQLWRLDRQAFCDFPGSYVDITSDFH